MSRVIFTGELQKKHFADVKVEMLNTLSKRGTFKLFLILTFHQSSTFWVINLLSNKVQRTKYEILEAGFAVQKYRDKLEFLLVHIFATDYKYSLNMLIVLASTLGFKIFSIDVTQVYIQSTESLEGDVYLGLLPKPNLIMNNFSEHRKPLYGLADSGGCRERPSKYVLVPAFGTTASIRDPASYTSIHAKQLNRMCVA